ncbi:MAG: Calx-beta domain-containing protein, partial [Gammaproteobacteria bacterium]
AGTISNDDPLPVLSIAGVSVVEGDSGTTNANFIVSLSAVSGQTVSVNYATSDGTALAGSDYTATNGTLSFPPGTSTQTVTVEIRGDLLNEAGETFQVNLSNAVNATLAGDSVLGAILNDDPLPALSIGDASVVEGDSGTTNALFTVSLSVASGQSVTVNFATADETAAAGSDYIGTNGSLSFAPGVTSRTVVVPVVGDVFNEANESFSVNLSNPVNTTVSDGQGVGTITNDDPLPALLISDVTVTEGDSGTTDAVFTVSLSAVSGQAVTVDYATDNGTALAGSDYIATNGTLSLAPGTSTQSITVKIIGDTLNELDETFQVNLSNPGNATLADSSGLGALVNNDPLPTLSLSDASVVEGNSGTTAMVFTVSLSAASGRTVTVNFATANATALAGTDYLSTNGAISLAPGSTSQTIAVQVLGDTLDEVNESFSLSLSSPVNATLGDGQGVGTINDDDPSPALSVNDVAVTEGNGGAVQAAFVVSLSAASGRNVSVSYSMSDGTATSGSDYVATSGSLNFPPGTTSQLVPVTVLGDLLNEANEAFFLNLTIPVNATISDGQGVGTINDDDPLPDLSIADVAVMEGDAGTTDAILTVTLSVVSGQTVTVDYATTNGTALAGTDYVATNGTVSFEPGETVQTITVRVNGDAFNEVPENFFVHLSDPGNANLANSQAEVTINNDDPLPTLAIQDVTLTEGNSGTTDALFQVSLSMASGQTVTVHYATADGTAAAGVDYRATNGFITLAPGTTNQTITVAALGDLLNEP